MLRAGGKAFRELRNVSPESLICGWGSVGLGIQLPLLGLSKRGRGINALDSHGQSEASSVGATQSNNYWSSTTYPANYSNAMNVNFNNGNANNNGKTNSNYVRCVRALPLPTLSLLRFLHTWRPSSL